MSDSLQPHGLYSPWTSLGQNTEVGSLPLLQWIFQTQELNQGLLHCRWILYQLSYQGSIIYIVAVINPSINSPVLCWIILSEIEFERSLLNYNASIKWLPLKLTPLEKEMATDSSIPAWKIPWKEKPGKFMGSQRGKHNIETIYNNNNVEASGPSAG